MWQRLSLEDVRTIGHYLGVLVLVCAITLIAPILTAIASAEWIPLTRYLLTLGIFLIAGSALRFLRIQTCPLSRQQAFAVTGLAWLVLSAFAAIPLAGSGHYASYLDALFESVSGFTTTGASIALDLDHMAYADNMWRFMMHLTGGLGLVVVGVSFGLFGKGAASMFTSEGRSEHVVPNVVQTTQFIAKITLTIIAASSIIVCAVCLWLGIEPARAILQSVWLSISAFMTAGFVPMSQNVMYYHSYIIEGVLIVIMLLGCINFLLHAEILKGKSSVFFSDMEIRSAFIWLLVISMVFAASLAGSRIFSALPTIERRGIFMIFAAFSTTGFQNIAAPQLTDALSSGAFLILAILMSVGACSGSTTGGIKIQRFGVLIKSVVSSLKESLSPETARSVTSFHHIGRKVVTPQLVREATTVTLLYGVTYIVGALVGIAHGYDASQAIFESVAMASNGGITSGIVVPGMPIGLEIFYIFEMWAGRLEFVTLLALLIQICVSIPPAKWIDKFHKYISDRRPRAFVSVALAVTLGASSLVGVAGAAGAGALGGVGTAYALDSTENLVDPAQRADNSFIYDTTVASLFSQASLYDARTVQILGEVIGDRVRAITPDSYWITLTETVKEDKSTISVLMSTEQSEQITHFGRYGVLGTTLQVRGTYHQACDQHDGLPDIHATTSSVLEVGGYVEDRVSPTDYLPGLLAIAAGSGLCAVYYIARERTR